MLATRAKPSRDLVIAAPSAGPPGDGTTAIWSAVAVCGRIDADDARQDRDPCRRRLLAALALATASAQTGGLITARIDEPFVLRLGGMAEIEGTTVRVRFEEVLDDSRCPIDVACVWSGVLRVRLGVDFTDPSGVAHVMQIEFDTLGQTGLAAGLRFSLLAAKPAPVSTRPIDPADYAALILVEAAPAK